MKIRLSFTVEVDPEAWYNTYGCARDEVRDDVKSHYRNLIQQSAAAEETGLKIVE